MQSEATIHAKLKWEPNKVTETNKEIKMQTKKQRKIRKGKKNYATCDMVDCSLSTPEHHIKKK